jgi:benzylsuccinate CoA-transferase BbsF subunit
VSAGVLEGLRVLELGSGAAGPVATRYLAEQGARVVRVESSRRPDFLRLFSARRGRPEALDAAPMFVLLNPNKESVALDLSRPEGVALARRLVQWADVVAENFAPGVMERWGLGWESLHALAPRLVMLRGCLFGQTGPERGYPGFGGQGSAIAGFNHLTGWPDAEALGPHATITDSLAPRYAALAVVAALLEREQTGRGRLIDLSQIEAGVYSLSEMVVRQSGNDETLTRRGNRDEQGAPHGVYPCRGEERWIAIAVFTDAEWYALRRAFRDPPWARDARFARPAGRLEHQAHLDERLADYTRKEEAGELALRLQRAGVQAGPVQDFEDLLADPQLAHRGHFVPLHHAHLGELPLERSGFRLAESPGELRTLGPDLGAHNEAVLGGILGLSRDEIERLVRDEIVA